MKRFYIFIHPKFGNSIVVITSFNIAYVSLEILRSSLSVIAIEINPTTQANHLKLWLVSSFEFKKYIKKYKTPKPIDFGLIDVKFCLRRKTLLEHKGKIDLCMELKFVTLFFCELSQLT